MPTGTWLEETAAPYYVFTGAGHTVDIVSIAGGEIPVDEVDRPGACVHSPRSWRASLAALTAGRVPCFDQGSTKGDFFTEDCKKFMADEAAQALFKNSKKLADYDTAACDIIYLGGGHGASRQCSGCSAALISFRPSSH
jgi:putative intracellular protease/amidase